MNKIIYKEISFDNIFREYQTDVILLVTATDLETSSTHKKLNPAPNHNNIINVSEGNLTYYFAKFGHYKVVHVQSGMGSVSRDSSIMTVTEAIEKLHPKLVIMIGVAFGIDDKKQNIGDVLVSEAILPYNFKKAGKNETVHRATDAPADKMLVNRFKNIRTWEYLLPNNKKASIYCTHILSGEELIDNKLHRDKLLKKFPTAKGGEMEGAGIYAACDGKLPWILVKGICDFADGNKSKKKKQFQNVAINSALSACLEVFSSKTSFKDFSVLAIEESTEESFEPIINVNEFLFDIYDSTKEKFYIVRDEDPDFQKKLIQYGI